MHWISESAKKTTCCRAGFFNPSVKAVSKARRHRLSAKFSPIDVKAASLAFVSNITAS